MKRQILAATLLGLSLISGGCAAVASRAIDSTSAAEAQTVTPTLVPAVSTDGRVRLMVPDTWQSREITEPERQNSLILALANRRGAVGLSVLTTPKRNGMPREVVEYAVVNSVKAVVGESGTVNQTSLEPIKNMPTLQYEGWGTFGDRSVGVLSVGIEAPDAYYNVMFFGDQAIVKELREEVDQIIQSIEIKAPQ